MAYEILKWVGIVTGSVTFVIIVVAVFVGPGQRGQ